jgi:GrpB-like predicted nucleotidyltransferase (UPF0157 family)
MDKPVKVVPYNPHWPEVFQKECSKMRIEFGDESINIEHIGSTSIPYLCAKPIIDIMIGIEEIEDFEKLIKPLAALGYKYQPEAEDTIPERRYFDKPGFHIHMVEINSDFWRTHIFFREYLRNHPDVRDEYCKLKMDLARKYQFQRKEYTKSKEPFIKRILRKSEIRE